MPLFALSGLKKIPTFLRSSLSSRTASLVTNGLVFHFDPSNPACYSGSGATCTDLTGINGNGAISGVTFTGGTDNAFLFSSANSYVVFNRSYTNVPDSHTFMAVVFIPYTEPGSYPAILSSVNSATGGIAMYPYQDDPVDFAVGAFIQDDPANVFDDINGVVYNSPAPHKVAITVTISPSTLRVYGNGIEVASSSPRGGGTINAQSQIQIGNATVALYQTFPGIKIYNGLIYNRPLSASEVMQNYNFLKSKYSLP